MNSLTCTIAGCERKHSARGWCATHYKRWQKYGDVNANFGPKRQVKGGCIAEGCKLEDSGVHGYCSKHAQAWRKHGDPLINKRATGRKVCAIDGCDKFVDGHGLCSTHWARNKKHGSPYITKPVPAWDSSPQWRGPAASYDAIHWRMRKRYGKASGHSCVDCSGQAEEWSYDGADPNQMLDGKLAYSIDPSHYAPRCIPCHRALDLAK